MKELRGMFCERCFGLPPYCQASRVREGWSRHYRVPEPHYRSACKRTRLRRIVPICGSPAQLERTCCRARRRVRHRASARRRLRPCGARDRARAMWYVCIYDYITLQAAPHEARAPCCAERRRCDRLAQRPPGPRNPTVGTRQCTPGGRRRRTSGHSRGFRLWTLEW